MSKIFVGTYNNHTCSAPTRNLILSYFGIDESYGLEITELDEQDYILRDVPEEFKGVLSHIAYEHGHSAGEKETLMMLEFLVSDLLPAIQEFETRVRAESAS